MKIFRLFVAFTFICFALSSTQAVIPPPDGGYPGFNTAEGTNALFNLTTGVGNAAVGWYSLFSNTDGSYNTAVGAGTLLFNIGDQITEDGTQNTAVGTAALLFNTAGASNTALGTVALSNNDIGNWNTATGSSALSNNTTGSFNTANGFGALVNNTTGNNNTAIGKGAGLSVGTASDVTCIGSGVSGGNVSNTTWIANVYGVATQNVVTAPVLVSANGQLGTMSSSQRFKKDIATMEKASESILSLRPVTFHYKTDTKGIPQFGLVAEEVAKVNRALVLPDKEGKPYTVRYEAVNAMLLNEFLKQHKAFVEERHKVEKLEATVAQQYKDFEAAVAELKGQIQKVSAQLKLSKIAPQTIVNNQ
jgi:hypothetical protein